MKWLLLAAVGLYLAYVVTMVLVHPQIIYPFQPQVFEADGYTQHDLPSGARYVEQVSDGPVVVYFMGNAGSLVYFDAALQDHVDAGRHVVAMVYPGGGGMSGQGDEAVMKAQALDIVDQALTFGKPVIVHGISMGSGLAVYAAAERDVTGVILDAPFARLCEVMAQRAMVPACWLPGVQSWRSLDRAADVSAPVLIFHGDGDILIQPRQSERLAVGLESGGAVVERHLLQGYGHTNLTFAPEYVPVLDAFVRRITAP